MCTNPTGNGRGRSTLGAKRCCGRPASLLASSLGCRNNQRDLLDFGCWAAHLLEPEESLDSEQTGIDLDEGYSPPESPRELGAWGLIASEARTHESLARRLARLVPDVTDRWDGDGIGDSADSDGEPIDDQVGDSRAGRLVAFGVDPTDPTTDYRAHDVGIDGGAASAEEAAMHIIAEDDIIPSQRWRSL